MKVKVREGAPSEPSGTQAVWALKLVKATILKRVQLKKTNIFFLENKSLQHNTDLFFSHYTVVEHCFKLVQILKGATEDYFSQGTCILGTELCATLAMTSHIQQIIMIKTMM